MAAALCAGQELNETPTSSEKKFNPPYFRPTQEATCICRDLSKKTTVRIGKPPVISLNTNPRRLMTQAYATARVESQVVVGEVFTIVYTIVVDSVEPSE